MFIHHTLVSASFYKIDKEDQRKDESEKYMKLNFNQKLTESDINTIDVMSHLEHQILTQEEKESG